MTEATPWRLMQDLVAQGKSRAEVQAGLEASGCSREDAALLVRSARWPDAVTPTKPNSSNAPPSPAPAPVVAGAALSAFFWAILTVGLISSVAALFVPVLGLLLGLVLLPIGLGLAAYLRNLRRARVNAAEVAAHAGADLAVDAVDVVIRAVG